MLSAVTTKFRNIIGISSSKPDTRKRSLEEESEDDIFGAGEGEPATKKRCRPHTERDEPMIRRSYNRLYKIFREGFSGVCSLASNFTLRSNSEPAMVDTSPSRNNRIKFTVSSKPSSSKIDRAQGGSNEVGYSRTAESPRPTRLNHLSRKMSSDDDIQLIEVRGQGDQSDQPTRRPALARRLPSPGSSQSLTPFISPSFQFMPTINPIPSQSTSDVKARPTIKEPIKLKNSEAIQKTPLINRKCGYITRNPVRGVHDRFLGTRMKMGSASQSGRGNSSAEESFRYEDKVRYRQLLQQFTSSSVLPSSYCVFRAPSRSSNVSNSSSSLGLVSRSRCNYIWTQEKRRQLEESLRASTSSSRPLLEGTGSGVNEPTTSKMTKDIPVIDLARTESTNSVQSANDSDKESVIFVEEVIQPSSRKNSLEEILQSSPIFQNNWYKDLRKEYDLRSKTSQKEVELATRLQKSLTERRIVQQSSMDDRLSRRMKFLDLTFPSKVEEIQPEEEPEEFIPLTSEMEEVISGALKRTPANEVLVDKFNIRITRRDIMTLSGLNWLNDEVINFYLNLIMERGENDNYPSVYAFNTFFYPKLVKSSHQSVKRWTKKVDIFSYKMVLIPVHLGMHWCLATIDFRDNAIRYYDSMLGNNDLCLESLLEYLMSEHLDKKSSQYDTSKWKTENVKSIPQQMNGSDCGMFTCKFAEYLSRNVPITFEQQHMPYFRRRMVYEIVTGHLL